LECKILKKIDAIVRAERMPLIKERLRERAVAGMTISMVMGWSKTRELHLQWRGQPVSYDLIQRAKFELVIPDSQVKEVVSTIIESARSGRNGEHGDGMIFVSSVDHIINVKYLG
jgi:nitrogen regulatory protein P-II 1